MNFQNVIVHVRITKPDNTSVTKDVDVIIIAGGLNIGGVMKVLHDEYPNCTIEIYDVSWVVDKQL
jgi:hypothetical protein